MTIHAWIFDLGNTLMSIPDDYDEEICLSEILGYDDTEQIRSIIYKCCDKYHGQTINDFLFRFDKAVNPNNREDLRSKIKKAWMDSVQHAQLKPGAWEILDTLRDKRVKLALISNTPPTSNYILDYLKLRERFDIIVLSCDVGYLKPDPRIFKIALQELNVLPLNTVVVGDKVRTDIIGGAILGMKSILVEERLRGIIENDQNYVDAIIPRLSDIKMTRLYNEMKI